MAIEPHLAPVIVNAGIGLQILDLARDAGLAGITGDEAERQILAHKNHSVSRRFAELVKCGSQAEDWVFASAHKLGRQPLSYTFVSENLGNAARKAGIGQHEKVVRLALPQ